MKRCFAAIVVALATIVVPLVGSATIAVPQAAAALHTCTATSSHYFDGFLTRTTSVIGTSAHIVNRLGLVCTTTTNSNISTSVNRDSAWSMLAGDSSCDYAQAGFVRVYDTDDYFFAQSDDCGTVDTTFGASPTFNQTHQYWVQWVPSCSCLRQNVDVTIFQSTPWNPKSVWSRPFSNQWLGEVHYKASDIPGNPTEGFTSYTSMQVQKSSTSDWTNTLPSTTAVNTDTSRYNHSGGIVDNFMTIWTYYGY